MTELGHQVVVCRSEEIEHCHGARSRLKPPNKLDVCASDIGLREPRIDWAHFLAVVAAIQPIAESDPMLRRERAVGLNKPGETQVGVESSLFVKRSCWALLLTLSTRAAAILDRSLCCWQLGRGHH